MLLKRKWSSAETCEESVGHGQVYIDEPGFLAAARTGRKQNHEALRVICLDYRENVLMITPSLFILFFRTDNAIKHKTILLSLIAVIGYLPSFHSVPRSKEIKALFRTKETISSFARHVERMKIHEINIMCCSIMLP